jgi:hypothetical protein
MRLLAQPLRAVDAYAFAQGIWLPKAAVDLL